MTTTSHIPRLNLAWDYTLLGYVAYPGRADRTFALVLLHKGGLSEYAVYRVDPSDGSCHGGRYPGTDLARAYEILGQHVAALGACAVPYPA